MPFWLKSIAIFFRLLLFVVTLHTQNYNLNTV